MAIDVKNEKLLSLKEASVLPGAPTWQGILRWIKQGVLVPGTQERVHLEDVWIGGRRFTSSEAFDRFLQKLNRSS